MTLMNSILFASAAGTISVAAAQAADLPTRKAAPAEYVRICNVGGMAGFILPGSDTCFNISGYITGQIEGGNTKQAYNWTFKPGAATVSPSTFVFNLGPAGGGNGQARFRNEFGFTTRLNVDVDARQDTAYGVLRGYAELQFENGNGFDNTGTGAYINRAYVQWAGITAGKANSFFSFFGGGEAWANIFSPDQQGFNQPDLLAYTATFGGGFSATISAQSPGPNGFSGIGTDIPFAGFSNYAFLGMTYPDIVGALRVDQSWGAAQVSGVAHQVHVIDTSPSGFTQNIWGWGVLGGVRFNIPQFGPGDNIQIQGVYTRNAYLYSGILEGMWGEDGAVNGNGLLLAYGDTWSNGNGTWATPTAWSIAATFEHHFSPQFMIAPEASYVQLNWTGFGPPALQVLPAHASSWIAGAAAHWDPAPHLDFEWELLYQSTHQSTPPGVVLVGAPGAPLTHFPGSADGFASRFEVTRDF